MPPDSQSFQQPRADPDVMIVDDYINIPSSPVETATDTVEVGNIPNLPQIPNHVAALNQPSTSSSSEKMLKFNVQYCDRIISIELPETATISKYFYKKKLYLK